MENIELRDVQAEVDWTALRQRIGERAQLPLARRRRRRTRPRFAVVGAVAAMLAGVAFFGAPSLRTAPDAPGAPAVSAADALASDLSDAEFVRLVSGYDDADGLLQLAAEEW